MLKGFPREFILFQYYAEFPTFTLNSLKHKSCGHAEFWIDQNF